jgi:hypothetical protein
MRAALIFPAFVVVACSRPPAARVVVRPIDGPRPPQVVARCRVDGLAPPVQYHWRLVPGARTVGWNPPIDEASLWVEVPPPGAPAWIECVATGADKVDATGGASLVAPALSAVPAAAKAGDLVTVHGAGFGRTRNDDDALWLVPTWGAARVADHACKGAAWSEAAVTACLPPSLPPGNWQLRVQAAGSLALAATWTRVHR